MLHIILLILKIIGWILLAILGLIVLLLCVVFFVPLCYRADGNCEGTLDSLYGKIRFSWLCRLVSGFVQYQDGKLTWTVRIAWKKMSAEEMVQQVHLDEPFTEEEDKFPYKSKEETVLPEDYDSGREQEAEEFESDVKRLEELMQEEHHTGEPAEEEAAVPVPEEQPVVQAESGEGEKETGTAFESENIPESSVSESTSPKAARIGKKKEKGPGFVNRIGNIYHRFIDKMKALYEKLKYTIHKICDTMKSMLEKKDKLLLFITDEVHKSALGAVLTEVRRLLRFLKPKKLKADIRFGFEDPYYTGQVLAALSMIYPFLGEHAEIEPDFEQKVLEGSIMISGKLRVLYVIIMLWNLVWNKNVRTTIKHIRKFEL